MGKEIPSGVATAFGGGIGRRGEVCGAVTGAALIIGLWGGRKSPEEKELYNRVHGKMQEFIAAFEREMGTVLCRELTGYDLRIPTELEKFYVDPERRPRCKGFVETAGRLLVQVLEGQMA